MDFSSVIKITGRKLHKVMDLELSYDKKLKGCMKKIVERRTRRLLNKIKCEDE